MTFWNEFKSALLPWLLAAVVVGVILHNSYRTEDTLRQTISQQADALDGIRTLLSTQGYVVPPSGTR